MYKKPLKGIRVAELAGIATEVINVLLPLDITAHPEYEIMVANLSKETKRLIDALSKDRAQAETADRDSDRDLCVSNIGKFISAMNLIFAEGEGTTQIKATWSKYGVAINRLNQSAQSGQIHSLLGEFEAIQTSVDAIPAFGRLVDKLRSAQTAFETAEAKYNTTVAHLKAQDTATLIKPLVIDALNTMVDYHNAMVQFKGEEFKKIADEVAVVIRDANSRTRSRSK
ncbi:MAG: hypothetical protein ACK5L5_06585 [Bacteroidales bacterium]